MSDELRNILSNTNDEHLDEEQLMKYLKDELDPTDRYELEKQIMNDPFGSDALEGLQEMKNNTRIELVVDGLNRNLKKRTNQKNKIREKLKLKTQWVLYFSILILLILIVLIFMYLHKSSV